MIIHEIPISRFTPDSRTEDTILCYDGSFSEGRYKNWGDFLQETALLRAALAASPENRWVLHAEDYWYFLVALTALFQCGKQPLLTANISPGYLAEITGEPGTALLSDQDIPGAVRIDRILSAGQGIPLEEARRHIPINPVESVFMLYTSGTTGKPKAVSHRLVEFEVNIGFPPEWVEAWGKRKNLVTVNQHHLYGLIFSIILPFTLGIPFRRKRIEVPEEFEALSDVPYMIFTTPAFLKRAAETGLTLGMKEPWIIVSGGFLPDETAKKTEELFGFWPIDIYGSTEGSGIAWRRSKDGPEWRPFGSIKVSNNEAGNLVIHLPIPHVPPIPTGDRARVLEDGRFILQGRADNIVKIEEKRVSLAEVEERILESGLVKETSVVPLEDRRQYLAAAMVFTAEGKAKFEGQEKQAINQFWSTYLSRFFEPLVVPKKWRYVDQIPQDSLGKRRMEDIQALFGPQDGSAD